MWVVLGVDFGTEAAPVASVKISTSSIFLSFAVLERSLKRECQLAVIRY